MNSLALVRNNVSVKIQDKPLTIEIIRRKPVLKRVSSEAEYEYNGHFRSFHEINIEKKENDVASLKCKGFGVAASLNLHLTDQFLEIRWESESGIIESISDTWIAPDKTYWYGQGQLQYQVFPLDDHISEMKPFLATNIQVPLWLTKSGGGILVDNYQLFETRFDRGITIRGLDFKSFSYRIIVGNNIQDARKISLKRIGLPKRIPDERVLVKPIFTTWVEFKKEVNQEKVMDFASNIRKRNFPCSVIQIDDKWEENYGDFTFDPSKFPDPKRMVDAIHEMGCLATLWVYPFINYESENYDYAKNKNYLVMNPDGDKPAEIKWWDGKGGLLDLSNPEAKRWFNEKLEALKRNYGFDGFKFDAGDGRFFPISRSDGGIARPVKIGKTQGGLTPNRYTDEWLKFTYENQYDLAEARVGYLAQRFGVIAREGDKESTWGLDNGLHAAITQALTLSLTGYPYIMPDMIGGNQYRYKCDKDLFIRWVEAVAFMPIVEYSITPWTYDEETTEIAKRYSLLHSSLGSYYVSLAVNAKERGDPIVCPLVLRFPEDDYCACINDEYLIGNLLVAPVIEKKRSEREVYLPRGVWLDFWIGEKIEGPKTVTVEAPLKRLPLYIETQDSNLVAAMKKAKREIFKK